MTFSITAFSGFPDVFIHQLSLALSSCMSDCMYVYLFVCLLD